jgi:hypothetical protein
MKTKHKCHVPIYGLLLTVLLVITQKLSAAPPTQEAQKPNPPSVVQLMSHQEFTKAGLQKLTPDEIKALDDWLQLRTNQIITTLVTQFSDQSGSGVISTNIEGSFEGWDGNTIWKMENGQIWQQASYAYHYHYAYRPSVFIYRTGGSWEMKVDGVSDKVSVKRIK